MELYCNNCHAVVPAPSTAKAPREVQCPQCGMQILLVAKRLHDEPNNEKQHKKHERSLQRVFDPIPRPLAYAAGLLLATGLVSPFIAYFFSDSYRGKPVIISEDSSLTNTPARVDGSSPAAPILFTNRASRATLIEFDGVRLGAPRDELDARFHLTLQNTRGMQPEIYRAEKSGGVERITADFYDNVLKEFSLLTAERSASVDDVTQDLIAEYGSPKEQSEATTTSPAGPPIGSLNGLTLPGSRPDRTDPLASYAFLRRLTWLNSRVRMDITIYHTGTTQSRPLSRLEVHLADIAWLKQNNPLRSSQPINDTLPTLTTNAVPPSPIIPIPGNSLSNQ